MQNTAFFPGISPTNHYVIGGHSTCRTQHSSLGSRLQIATSSAVIAQAEHRILPWDLAYKSLRHRRSLLKQNTAFFPGISPTNHYVIGGHSTCRTQYSSLGSRLQIATSSVVIPQAEHRILPWNLAYESLHHRPSFTIHTTAFFLEISLTNRHVRGLSRGHILYRFRTIFTGNKAKCWKHSKDITTIIWQRKQCFVGPMARWYDEELGPSSQPLLCAEHWASGRESRCVDCGARERPGASRRWLSLLWNVKVLLLSLAIFK